MTPARTHSVTSKAIEERVEQLLGELTLDEKASLLSGCDDWSTVAIDRLGIPSIVMTDGPHGVRSTLLRGNRKTGATSAFPTGVSLASTWNPELVE
jgi:beta-glucosidase